MSGTNRCSTEVLYEFIVYNQRVSTISSETVETADFHRLGIESKILNVLDRLHFRVPTPIQQKAIPVLLEGNDIIGMAQTGTGKTLAFALPMLQRFLHPNHSKGKGLILLPTRELAIQIEQTFQKIGRSFGVRTAVLIGGSPMGKQIQDLRNHPQVIIATPGRMVDHLQRRTVSLHEVRMLVLDEADRMLDMGFAPQIKQILQAVPKERQTMLFSATMSDDIVKIAMTHMKLPVRVEIARPGTVAQRVEQEVFIIKPNQKNRLLEALLNQYPGAVLIFSRTKHGARKICSVVKRMGHAAAEIHSDRSLNQRREALQGFQRGKYRVLAATDIAARGIDVEGIELVINYDVPEYAGDYVHRIGRTGRAGRPGRAITFATPEQGHKVRHIERFIRTALRVSKLPELPADREPPPSIPSPYSRPSRPPFHSRDRRPHSPSHPSSYSSSRRKRF